MPDDVPTTRLILNPVLVRGRIAHHGCIAEGIATGIVLEPRRNVVIPWKIGFLDRRRASAIVNRRACKMRGHLAGSFCASMQLFGILPPFGYMRLETNDAVWRILKGV